ncbi:MAG: hypothetical protein J1G01_04300 [Clostridiales bacterium]|nr:hypothetical protein [Clostridiales bacterium]
MENNTHDYHKTIEKAAGIDNDSDRAQRRAEDIDRDAAYEALALTSSMGMLGLEPTNANLLQMELAQELLYKFNDENFPNSDNEFRIGD